MLVDRWVDIYLVSRVRFTQGTDHYAAKVQIELWQVFEMVHSGLSVASKRGTHSNV